MVERLALRAASQYVGIPENTLRWWRQSDTGPRSYALGGKVFYDIADLDQWVEEQKAASARGGVQ